MKKLFFLAVVITAFTFLSCSEKEDNDMTEKAKKNIEAVQAVVKAFETGDVSKIDDVVAENFIDHTERGDMGRDSLKAAITIMHKQDSTLKFNTIKEFADDEYAAIWYKLTGTSDGTMGMPKGPYEMHTIDMVKLKDGKAVEHWSFMELQEMMKMMAGSGQQASMDNKTAEKKDTIPPVK